MKAEPSRAAERTEGLAQIDAAHRAERPSTPPPVEPTTEEVLAVAMGAPLMGKPESWDHHGGKALGDRPDKVLLAALRFFKDKLRTSANPRMEEQVQYISLILADREAHSAQAALALGAPPVETQTHHGVPEEAVATAHMALATYADPYAPSADFPGALQDDDDDLPF